MTRRHPAAFAVLALTVLSAFAGFASAQDASRIAALTAKPTLTLPEQEELAKALFSVMAKDKSDDPALYEKHYLTVMAKCPDTRRAHESYWRLTNLYLRAYDEPKHDKIVTILEQFLKRYTTSDVVSMKKYPDEALVFSPLKYLHQSYEELKQYDKIAAYYDGAASRESEFAIYDYFDYAQALDEVKRTKDAITWYEKFLKKTQGDDSVDFMREIAADRVKELKAGKQ